MFRRVKFMSWNIYFKIFKEINLTNPKESQKKIIQFIESESPDILFVQESPIGKITNYTTILFSAKYSAISVHFKSDKFKITNDDIYIASTESGKSYIEKVDNKSKLSNVTQKDEYKRPILGVRVKNTNTNQHYVLISVWGQHYSSSADNTKKINNFINLINQILTAIYKNGDVVIISGDFNEYIEQINTNKKLRNKLLNEITVKENNIELKLNKPINTCCGNVSLNRTPLIVKKTNRKFDIFFHNNEINIVANTYAGSCNESDHLPIIVEFSEKNKTNTQISTTSPTPLTSLTSASSSTSTPSSLPNTTKTKKHPKSVTASKPGEPKASSSSSTSTSATKTNKTKKNKQPKSVTASKPEASTPGTASSSISSSNPNKSKTKKKSLKKPSYKKTKKKNSINNLKVVPSESKTESFFECVVEALEDDKGHFYHDIYKNEKEKQKKEISFYQFVKNDFEKKIKPFMNNNVIPQKLRKLGILKDNAGNEYYINAHIIGLIEETLPIRFIIFNEDENKKFIPGNYRKLKLYTPYTDIQYLLNQYQEDEELGDRLEVCGDLDPPYIRKIQLEPTSTNPSSIIIQLKRYNNSGNKLNTNIKINNEIIINEQKYYLKGYILHLGKTIKSGHYVFVEIRNQQKSLFDDKSYIDNYKNKHNDIENAYIFLYDKEEPNETTISKVTFRNPSCQCFLNSSLQLLYRITKLRKKILESKNDIKKININKNMARIDELKVEFDKLNVEFDKLSNSNNNEAQIASINKQKDEIELEQKKLKCDNLLAIIYQIFFLMNKYKSNTKIIDLNNQYYNSVPLINYLEIILDVSIDVQEDSGEYTEIIVDLICDSTIGIKKNLKQIVEIPDTAITICSNGLEIPKEKVDGGQYMRILSLPTKLSDEQKVRQQHQQNAQSNLNNQLDYIMLQNPKKNKFNLYTFNNKKIFKFNELPNFIQNKIQSK